MTDRESSPSPVAAVILCGGVSQRMGRAKAMLPWRDGTMLEQVIAALQPLTTNIELSAARGQELPPLPPNCQVTYDEHDAAGPLPALCGALQAIIKREHSGWVIVRAVDMPELAPQWYATLLSLIRPPADAVCPQIDNRLHPLAGIVNTDCLERLTVAWNRGERALHRALAGPKLQIVTAAELRAIDPDFVSVRNINTPEDYAAALRKSDKEEQYANPSE